MTPDDTVSRREFIHGAAASFIAGPGAPVLWQAASLAQAPGANERIRLALIGCGGQGQHDLTQFKEQGAQIVAVCDPDENRMREAREMAGGAAERFVNDAAADAYLSREYRAPWTLDGY